MDAIQKKELLHLRIEQANEQMLDALAEMAETLFKTWQPEVIQEAADEEKTEAELAAVYAKHLKPMTRQEMKDELTEAMADYERGDYVTLEEMKKESATWQEESSACCSPALPVGEYAKSTTLRNR